MNKLNPVQAALAALALATTVILIAVPLVFFVSISLSNETEFFQFPKRLAPSLSVTVQVKAAEEGAYEIFTKRNGVFESSITTKNPAKLENFFSNRFGVTRAGSALLADFSRIPAGGTREFTYAKNMLYNFKVFFSIVSGAKKALLNSIVAALMTIAISLSLGSMAGYAMARYRFAFKDQINVVLLIVRMFPAVGISVPLAVLMIKFRLFDTLIGLAILYSIPNISLTAWITSSVFIGISRELEEAALVFGATGLGTFRTITLPLALPALAASSMYAFLTAWNDTISALILTRDNQTLSLVVYKAIGSSSAGIQYAAAGSVILIIPALAFTFIARRYVVQMWGGVGL